ncbi:MAG TPA: hypothetical protein VFY93_04320 [Planctomycetota bacterium]|nr:hypothetical protein [Planctomycetota bacterium]
MTPLAVDFPSPEFIIFAVAILLGVIGKIVEFSRQVRRKSLEETERTERQFGSDLGEAPEPPPVAPPPKPPPALRLDLFRRPLPPREPSRPVPGTSFEFPTTPVPPPVVRPHAPRSVVAPPEPLREHPLRKLLRERRGARTGILLAEILGPPKALRRWR